MRKCHICKKDFTSRRRSAFCSKKCAGTFYRNTSSLHKKKEPAENNDMMADKAAWDYWQC